jgi:carbamate kinase
MGPKVHAACQFVERTGKTAAIGSITDAAGLVSGRAGTLVTVEAEGLEPAEVA